MAHIRRPLAAAAILNTAVFAVEAVAGARAHSLSLLMDSIHNFSDELALLCLLAAYAFAVSLSRGLQRIANLLNSVGLIALSIVVLWQAVDRLFDPRPVIGWVPATVGLLDVGRATGGRALPAPLATRGCRRIRLPTFTTWTICTSLRSRGRRARRPAGRPASFDPRSRRSGASSIWLVASTAFELRRSGEDCSGRRAPICPHDGATGADGWIDLR